MNFKNETDLIKVLGWSKSSKMIFILRMINNNMTKEDIYKEWSFFTDPKNLQPKVRKINRDIQKHLVDFPPNISTSQALNAILNPLNGNQERQLRIILKSEEYDQLKKSELLVEKIKSLGIEPFKQPDTYPEINSDLINLVCWMGIIK